MIRFFCLLFLVISSAKATHHCKNFQLDEYVFLPKPVEKFGVIKELIPDCRALIEFDDSSSGNFSLKKASVATDSNVGWRAFEISRFCWDFHVFDRVYYPHTSWMVGEISRIAGNCYAEIRVVGDWDETHIVDLFYSER